MIINKRFPAQRIQNAIKFHSTNIFSSKTKPKISSPPKHKKQSQNFAQLPQSTNNTQTTTIMMNVLNHNILDNHENKNEKCTRNFVM